MLEEQKLNQFYHFDNMFVFCLYSVFSCIHCVLTQSITVCRCILLVDLSKGISWTPGQETRKTVVTRKSICQQLMFMFTWQGPPLAM